MTNQTTREREDILNGLMRVRAFLRGVQLMNRHPHDSGLESDLFHSIRFVGAAMDQLEKLK